MRDYHINVSYSEEDECWVADLPDLEYCSAFGDTPEEAVAQVQIAKEAPLIRGGTNQPLYWLVLLSRHRLAADIWNSVADKSPQGKFSF